MSRRDELSLRDYLGHIEQAVSRIQRYSTDLDLVAFLENEEKQDAIIRNLEILGEAAGNIRQHFPEFVTRYPDFPLRAAYETRNALAHGYFQVDLDIVWRTVQRDLPLLQEQVRNVLDALRFPSSG